MSCRSDEDDDDNDCFFDASAGELSAGEAADVQPTATFGSEQPVLLPRQETQDPEDDSSRPRNWPVVRRLPATSDSSRLSPVSAFTRVTLRKRIPQVPAIPTRFLDSGRPATVIAAPATRNQPLQRALSERQTPSPRPSSPVKEETNHALLEIGGGGDGYTDRVDAVHRAQSPQSNNLVSHGLVKPATTTTTTTTSLYSAVSTSSPSRPSSSYADSRPAFTSSRRQSLPAHAHKPTLDLLELPRSPERPKTSSMSRRSRAGENDPFLELAQDEPSAGYRRTDRGERIATRLSNSYKRRSLPAGSALAVALERSAGNAHMHTSMRAESVNNDFSGRSDRYRTPPNALPRDYDTGSVSGRSVSSRVNRFAGVSDRSMPPSRLAERLRSPELAERRQSFGSTPPQSHSFGQPTLPSTREQETSNDSPVESSDARQSPQDSASGDSQTADTVWDELDDLKSRIKKLELTGKLPSSSHAAISGEQTERPRTATTAPTTIDSSPKREQKPEAETVTSPRIERAPSTPTVTTLHPLLHSALAKAKPLLNPSLYRSLEASANDALGMAVLSGAGAQGSSSGSSTTASDRVLKRKADSMCRNLTDLCLALCDGKHEPTSSSHSPIVLSPPPVGSMNTIRHSRSIISNDGSKGRPMSRLEARRSSILGLHASNSFGLSPRVGGDDASGSEQESVPPRTQDLRRVSRASSRLRPARIRYEDVSGDEDPTIRPPSRAMTNVSSLRGASDRYRELTLTGAPRRSPSLRETVINRRVSTTHDGLEEFRPISRVTSMPVEQVRRRNTEYHVTPVMEEEDSIEHDEPQVLTQPKRRMSSFAASTHASARRAAGADLLGRPTSMTQRRDVAVE